MKKKYIEVDTRLPFEKKESKLKLWFDNTYLGMWIQIQKLKRKIK